MYHVSTKYWGKRKLIYPRKIDDATYPTPCICVCPTVEQCLLAMPTPRSRCLFVYSTQEKGSNRFTKQIFDYKYTEEHRIYNRAIFDHVFTIDASMTSWIKEAKRSIDLLQDTLTQHNQNLYPQGLLVLRDLVSNIMNN